VLKVKNADMHVICCCETVFDWVICDGFLFVCCFVAKAKSVKSLCRVFREFDAFSMLDVRDRDLITWVVC
jgi:hypothetical protein